MNKSYAWKDTPWTLGPPSSEPKRSKSAIGTVSYWKDSVRRISVFTDIDLKADISFVNLWRIRQAYESTAYGYKVRDLFLPKQRNEIDRVLSEYGF